MLHILIADDEKLARQRLSRLIEQLSDCELIGEAMNGRETLELVDRLDPDLVLLDVRMPGKDGLEVARELSTLHEPPAIVFCTAYDEYALEAFDTLAMGYIVKPVQLSQLQGIIEKAARTNKLQKQSTLAALEAGLSKTKSGEQETLNKQSEKLLSRQNVSAKTHHGIELIPIENIFCFIADQKYVTVMHKGGETLIDDTLKELQDELAQRFVRVHRNALVAIDEIDGLIRAQGSQYQLRLKSSEYMPAVSRRHLQGLKQLLTHL